MAKINNINEYDSSSILSFIGSVVAVLLIVNIGLFFSNDQDTCNKVNDMLDNTVEKIGTKLINYKRTRTILIKLIKLSYK